MCEGKVKAGEIVEFGPAPLGCDFGSKVACQATGLHHSARSNLSTLPETSTSCLLLSAYGNGL